MVVMAENHEFQPFRNEELRRLVFIANPYSGTRKKNTLDKTIQRLLDDKKYTYSLEFTQFAGHATQLAREAAASGVFAVIAVGGDGTINEVVNGIVGSGTALGVLPFGSGNGFAYHIGIKRSVEEAFHQINQGICTRVDTARANNRLFLNVAGLGLDATVAFKTKNNKKRGFFPYFFQTLKESYQFQYLTLKLSFPKGFTRPFSAKKTFEGPHSWEEEYAMAVIANGSIYGYGFAIAPSASLIDGQFDVLLVKKAPVFRYFFLAARMITKSVHKSPLVDYIRTPQLTVTTKKPGYAHLDGEGFASEKTIDFVINPGTLNTLYHG